MATYIKTLKEDNGDITYPQTKAGAVLLNNGSDLETELSQYVTAEDIASTSALTPPVQTNMIANGAVTTGKIADGAVTSSKIDLSTLARAKFVRPKINNVNINYQADYTQGTWTCDESGLYLVYFYQKIQGAYSAHDFVVKIFKNNTQASYATIPLDWAGISTMALLSLVVGDVVKFISAGGTGSVQTADGQAFIVRISN